MSFTRTSLVFAFIGLTSSAQAKDLYLNFEQLRSAHREGQDYIVTVQDSSAPMSVIAPHGGAIEWGTEELARDLALSGMNLYLFESRLCKGSDSIGVQEGLCQKDRFGNLHLTSHHFDDPRAVALAEKSLFCVSLHGYGSREDSVGVMFGGLSEDLKKRMLKAFKEGLPEVKIVPPKHGLAGAHPKNIVNRCQEQGVQLEFSPAFRMKLRKNASFRKRVSDVIQDVVFKRCLEIPSASAAQWGTPKACSRK